MNRIQLLVLALALTSQAKALTAQNPGQKLSIDIQVRSVAIRGDTIGIASQVTNLASSQESLLLYLVDAPSGVTQIGLPSPATSWDANTDYRARPMAVWSPLELLPATGTTPELYFESIGVPGILNYWARGKFQHPADEDVPDSAVVDDPLATGMINGKTVGVIPWPIDRTPAGLLARLRTLTQSSCDAPLLWITDPTLCSQLISDIDQAEAYRSNGQTAEAKGTLNHYVGLLSGPTTGTFAPGVSSSGYWLLKTNADIINGLL